MSNEIQLVLAEENSEIRSLIDTLTHRIAENEIVLNPSRFAAHISEISSHVAETIQRLLDVKKVKLHGNPRDIYGIRKFLTAEKFRCVLKPYTPEINGVSFHLEPRVSDGRIDVPDHCPVMFSLETIPDLVGVRTPKIEDYFSAKPEKPFKLVTVEKQPWFFGPQFHSSQSVSRRLFDPSGESLDSERVRVDTDLIRRELVWCEAYRSDYSTALMETTAIVANYHEKSSHWSTTETLTCLLALASKYSATLTPLFNNDFYLERRSTPKSHSLQEFLNTLVQEGILRELPTQLQDRPQYRLNKGPLRGRARLGMPERAGSDDDCMGYGQLIYDRAAMPYLRAKSQGRSILDYATIDVPDICRRLSFSEMKEEAKKVILGNESLRCRNIEHIRVHPS